MRIIRTLIAVMFLIIFGLFVLTAILDFFNPARPNPLTLPLSCKGTSLALASCLATMFGKLLVYIIPLVLGLVILPKSKKTDEVPIKSQNLDPGDVAIPTISTTKRSELKFSTKTNIEEPPKKKNKELHVSQNLEFLDDENTTDFKKSLDDNDTEISEFLTKFPNAKIALEYRPEMQDALKKIELSSHDAKYEILSSLENNPRMGQLLFEELINEIIEKHSGPFEKREMNKLYFDLRNKNIEAAQKFKDIIEILGEDANVEVIIKKINKEFSLIVVDSNRGQT